MTWKQGKTVANYWYVKGTNCGRIQSVRAIQ